MSRNVKTHVYPFYIFPSDTLVDGPPHLGGKSISVTSPSMLIWVDLDPESRFEHPTRYILISTDGVRVEEGVWWPVLNGRQILYGQQPFLMQSPFDLGDFQKAEGVLQAQGDFYGVPIFAPAHDAAKQRTRQIVEVCYVDLVVLETSPPKLLISVIGRANFTGWSDPILVPRQSRQPWFFGSDEACFDLMAYPPLGIEKDTPSPITAQLIYEGDFSKWKGVSVGGCITPFDSGKLDGDSSRKRIDFLPN